MTPTQTLMSKTNSLTCYNRTAKGIVWTLAATRYRKRKNPSSNSACKTSSLMSNDGGRIVKTLLLTLLVMTKKTIMKMRLMWRARGSTESSRKTKSRGAARGQKRSWQSKSLTSFSTTRSAASSTCKTLQSFCRRARLISNRTNF